MDANNNWTFFCPLCGTRGMAFEDSGYCPDCDGSFARRDVEGAAGAAWSARVTDMQFQGGEDGRF